MTRQAQLKRLHTLIWVLIFGGLLGLVYGLSLSRYRPEAGLALVVAGSLVAAVGGVLIFVRARLKDDAGKD